MKFETLYHWGKRMNGCVCGRVIAKLLKRFLKVYFCCDIPYEADIAKSVYFCHNAFGVVINPNTVIKENVCIQNGVLCGEINDSHGSPYIEDNVYIGAKAMLLGKIRIGKNSKIGAGAVVLCDVPENSTVVGNPARIIRRDKS